MRHGRYLFLTLGLLFGAYQMAHLKMERPLNLQSIRLGMSLKDAQINFGLPSARTHNQYTYILNDGSELTLTLRDKRISSANVRFKKIIKIQDPEMRRLTLVQMATPDLSSNYPTWFFAGKPSEGLIYKITSEGIIVSLTWVPPFSVRQGDPKNLQALLRDFRIQRSL